VNSTTKTTAFVWKSQNAIACPSQFKVLSDQSSADEALSLARQGMGLLWQGDYHLARQMLLALGKRAAIRKKAHRAQAAKTPAEQFHAHRLQLTQHHQLLNRLCIQIEPDGTIALNKAPPIKDVLQHVWGTTTHNQQDGSDLPWRVSLKELLGWIGAYEWFKNGISVAELDSAGSQRIHPHFGVFAPSRKDYLQLVHDAPLPASKEVVFDIGVGTGVLSAILLNRGMQHAICTDLESRSLECARDNFQRLGLSQKCTLIQTDLFPEGLADLIVCNPPWLPGKARSPLERAVFDEGSHMLKGYLAGLGSHLKPNGEGWLIISDLAERLGLRSPCEIEEWVAMHGLQVIKRHSVLSSHPKSKNTSDPFHQARASEITSLWRLGVLNAT
jgi:tRNA1(Val) A37 N6-methylase TrmN6